MATFKITLQILASSTMIVRLSATFHRTSLSLPKMLPGFPKPFRPRSPQGQGQYDSGLERDDMPTRKNGHNFNQSNDPSITESDADTEVRYY